jgi:hypothetical protein
MISASPTATNNKNTVTHFTKPDSSATCNNYDAAALEIDSDENNNNNIDNNNYSDNNFKRRVSFDNYQPDIIIIPPLETLTSTNYFFPTTKALNNNNNNNNNNNSSNSEYPHHQNKKNQHQPTSILKWGNDRDRDKIDNYNYNNNSDLAMFSSINNNFNDFNLNKNKSLSSSQSLSTSPISNKNSNFINLPNSNNNVSHDYTLQPPTSINNIRKKPYSEMSDSELLALDAQFNIRSVDFQKSYGFNVAPRLSTSSISNSDKDSLINKVNTNFKNLSPNAILKEYPTKPIMTKNSICINFKHSNLKNNDLNDKFYLIILSNKSSSLSSLNYYINNKLNKGDNLIICCSLSTSILGNDRTDQLDNFILQFTSLILNYLDSNNKITNNPINITFEFFKSFSYFNDVTNLYQPSLIIIGSNNEKTKSTSLTTNDKKLLSVVVVGNDQINNTSNSNSNSDLNSNITSQVTFRIPFTKKEKQLEKSKQSTLKFDLPSILVNDKTCSSTESLSIDSNNLLKMKSNDTTASSLFDNLNDTPDLELSKLNSNSTTNSNNNNINLTTSNDQPRRKSMLDVLNIETRNSISKNSNRNIDNSSAIDDSIDSKSSTTNKFYRPRSNNSSFSNTTDKALTGHAKEKQDLFEKYQKRLSAVNVSNIPKSKLPAASKNQEIQSAKKSESKGFFKSWFK